MRAAERPTRPTLIAVAWFIAASSGCGFDERTLLPYERAAAGRSGTASTGGSAGLPSEGEVDEDGPDLDGNGLADALETLVQNPSFDDNAELWEIDPFTGRGWSPEDIGGRRRSGSISVANIVAPTAGEGMAEAGSRQCIPVTANREYVLIGGATITSGFGLTHASLSIRFHARGGCVGPGPEFRTEPLEDTDRWQTLHVAAGAPPGSVSATIGLEVEKPDGEDPVEARFDAILVKQL